MIRLVPPVKPFEVVRAIAASGSSGVARKAQAELLARTTESLRRAVKS